MSSKFFEQGDLPEKVYKGFVRRVVPGLPAQVMILSPNFWKCYVHYKGRSVGCLKTKEKCPGCKMNWPRKMLTYLYCRNERNLKLEHLELPFEAAHDLADLVGVSGLLRGTRLHATRVGGAKGKITFNLLDRIDAVAPGFELPQDSDPGGILEYLWGVNYGKLKLFDNDGLPERDAI